LVFLVNLGPIVARKDASSAFEEKRGLAKIVGGDLLLLCGVKHGAGFWVVSFGFE
jgi:hypothetical protein